MRNYCFTLGLFFLAFCGVLNAQKVHVASLKGLKIRNIGPAAMSGRITAIDVDLSNTNRIYAGAASGGVWLSENGGIDWTPIFDEQPNQAIGAITINQKNPAEVWVGTGEGNPRNSQNSGGGIFKSMDGGKTWTLMGLEGTKVIHRIIVHRDNPDVVYVGAQGSAWGKSEHRGVYRTTNGGKTWEKILYVNDETGIADLVVDPSNPSKMMAAMWEFGRQPWFFNSGGKGSGIYVTHDGGNNWKRLDEKNGMPEGMLGRVGLAIAPSSPNIVYALIEAKENGLYKSTDGGNKFVKIADDKKNIGDRPFYYYDIFVDPQNENRVYSLYSLVSRSEDGGKNFEVILPYSGENAVHPDHHAFWIDPNNPSYMINGNDGGLYISRDKGKTWRFAENIPVGQFYHINYDMSYPYNISGGLQDNGSWVGPSAVWKPGGIRNSDWQEVFFGDGFDVLFHPKDSRFVYAMSQGGNLGFIDRETGKTRFIKPVHPEGKELRFHWNTGIAQDPFKDCGVYYGSQYLHKSSDCGTTWEIISPDLTTNDSTKQQQIKTGGLTIDNTTAENHTTILAIAPSPVDEGTIWVGTDDGNLQLTRDGGKTWTNLASRLPGVKAGSWIPFIEVSQKNAGEAFIIVNDYRRNDWRPMAFHTNDFGKTFKQIVNEKQVQGHALAIIQDLVAPNLLWLGTDFGLYFTIDGGANWNKWMNGYPSVSTIDLKIHPREHDLIVGTFGRSIWVLDDIRPIRAIAQSQGKVLDTPFKAFESPDAYLANYRSYDGTRFVGDGIYRGDNRSAGAMMTLWVKPMVKAKNTEKEDTKKDEKKKVKIQIINNAGDTIRTYTSPVDTGMNRIYWNLRQDGVRYPSREKAKAEDNLPPGNFVLPGKYQVLFTYETHKDSTTIQVHFDPRLDIKNYDVENIAAIYNDYYALVKKAADGYDRVRTAKESIDMVQKMMSSEKDSTYQEIHKMGKTLLDTLKAIELLYFEPENIKGIQRSSDNLLSSLFTVSRYLGAIEKEATPTVELLMRKATEETESVLNKIQRFYEIDFATYQEKVENVKLPIFKTAMK
jgi:photosystem II stability/assembly factor-like uncharacterized protein